MHRTCRKWNAAITAQFNLVMFCDEDTRMPLYYARYNGSLTDRSNLSCVLANAKDIGSEHVHMFMDGGFWSEECIQSLARKCDTFTLGMPSYLADAEQAVGQCRNQIERYANELPDCHIYCMEIPSTLYGVSDYIYNDKFTLNVLDLNQIKLATDEDKRWKLDYWARLFKARTWEELKMLAQQDSVFMETCETIYEKNQDDVTRKWCEAYEEAERVARTYRRQYERDLAQKDAIIEEQGNVIAEKENVLAEKENVIAEKENVIAEKENVLAEQERLLADKDAEIARLRLALAEAGRQR